MLSEEQQTIYKLSLLIYAKVIGD